MNATLAEMQHSHLEREGELGSNHAEGTTEPRTHQQNHADSIVFHDEANLIRPNSKLRLRRTYVTVSEHPA